QGFLFSRPLPAEDFAALRDARGRAAILDDLHILFSALIHTPFYTPKRARKSLKRTVSAI
ncbi:MAG TPA: hypothetical protein PLP58_16100, partial [Prosthecobacter sp.]|nr:hypothetical protein [Prosthecobacter sp.]